VSLSPTKATIYYQYNQIRSLQLSQSPRYTLAFNLGFSFSNAGSIGNGNGPTIYG
jgi:hypothetical protein